MAHSRKRPDHGTEVYVAVCTQFHGAHGIFIRASDAVAVCRQLNANPESDCEYVPVPLLLADQTQISVVPPSEDTPLPDARRGYL